MDFFKEIFVGGLEAEEVAVGSGVAPFFEFLFRAFAEAKCDSERCFGFDLADEIEDGFGGESEVFAGLEDDGSVAKFDGLTGAIYDLFGRHSVAFNFCVTSS